MGKNKKSKKEKQEPESMGVAAFAFLNAIDMKVMIQELEGEWKADEHSDIENYFHYRAELMGR